MLQGRYQVVQLFSAGGFCQTYLAKDTCQLGHPICVVKHILPASYHPQSLQTLKQLVAEEAEALKKLDGYDLVPQLLNQFEENLEFYLVQEFIEGRPLSAELQRGFRWGEIFVIQLLQEVLEILEVVHAHKLIHGDIKPSNLIRRRLDDRLVLIDFGCVKQASTQVATTKAKTNTIAKDISATITVGTPGYMPAEQVRGFPRPNSDIYALGIIAIQALTGLHPRQLREDSETGEIIWQHQANVRPQLACVLNKMVRYHFKDRYSCATEVLEALKTLAILYQPTQPLGLIQQKATSAQVVATAIQKPPVLVCEDTMRFVASDRPAALLDNKSDSTHPTRANNSVLLIGIGIGVTSVLALTASIYYFLRSPVPAAKTQHYQMFYPN